MNTIHDSDKEFKINPFSFSFIKKIEMVGCNYRKGIFSRVRNRVIEQGRPLYLTSIPLSYLLVIKTDGEEVRKLSWNFLYVDCIGHSLYGAYSITTLRCTYS